MTVTTSRAAKELEERGEDELVLAAIRYTGPNSTYNSPALQNQGGLPTHAPLQGRNGRPGPWKVVLIPSKSVGYFEKHSDLEIAYDRETVATAFLEKNTLPSNVFGDRIDSYVQERVLDRLGIERVPRTTEGIREELAEIAGADVDPGEEAGVDTFDYDLTRSELWSVAKVFDPPFTWNEMQSTEAEEFLLEQDPTVVRRLIGQLRQGEDPSLEALGEDVQADLEAADEAEAEAEEDETDGEDSDADNGGE